MRGVVVEGGSASASCSAPLLAPSRRLLQPASSSGCGRRASRGASSSSRARRRRPRHPRPRPRSSPPPPPRARLRRPRAPRPPARRPRAPRPRPRSVDLGRLLGPARRARRLLGLALERDRLGRRLDAVQRRRVGDAVEHALDAHLRLLADELRGAADDDVDPVELADRGARVVLVQLDQLQVGLGALGDRSRRLQIDELALGEHGRVIGVRALLRREEEALLRRLLDLGEARAALAEQERHRLRVHLDLERLRARARRRACAAAARPRARPTPRRRRCRRRRRSGTSWSGSRAGRR